MGRIAALGDRHRIQLLALAGVESYPVVTEDEIVAAWRDLPADVTVLVLTADSAAVLRDRVAERRDLLVTVLP
ncbi:MAG TPA: V-type ATP synthase subunit F [Candidatus Dormibacteraeota bacterium]|nr:V-type ATP synthase subunit F [Candidatus Dormibacteraeota bacterium]